MSATANVTKADFYEVLQVSRDASDQELKASYRRLAMQYHPDRNPNNPEAEEKFKACSEAYQVLSDAEKRAAYDRYGHAAFQGGGAAGNPFAGAGFQGDLGDIFGDLFGEMFNMGGGGGRRATRAQRGRDLRYDMTLEFEEAAFGVEKQIEIRRLEACEECRGTGSAKGKAPATCSAVRRAWTGAVPAGVLLGGKDLRAMQRDGDDDQRSMHGVPRRGIAGQEARDPGEGAGGGGAGDAHPLPGRGRGGAFRRAGGRSVCGAEREGAQVLRARGRRPALRSAGLVSAGGAGDGVADRDAGGDGDDQDSRGDTERARVQAEREGRATPELARQGRSDGGGEGGDAVEAEPGAEGLLQQLSETMTVENTPTSRGLFEKMKEMFS